MKVSKFKTDCGLVLVLPVSLHASDRFVRVSHGSWSAIGGSHCIWGRWNSVGTRASTVFFCRLFSVVFLQGSLIRGL